MSCEGKKGQELKDCNKKLKDTKTTTSNAADLNAANFKNKDVVVWSRKPKPPKQKESTPRPIGLATLNTRTKIPRLKKR